ncbi:MAG: hypothetical protein J3Q66DRAFT_293889, partial [Benniella sp.]
MLVLYETPAGYALFTLLDDGKLEKPDAIWKDFETPEQAKKTIKLRQFVRFQNTTDALSAVTGLVEGKLPKNLKDFLSKEITDNKEMKKESLIVGDSKLGGAIAKKLNIKVISDSTTVDLYRGIRSQLSELINVPSSDMSAMVLGLSHSLSRYKLKFSPDKVDTMIVQAIALLDDLDKELNTYAMRVKEWYGWHFPEMTKLIIDNLAYAKIVKKMGFRANCSTTDLSDILPDELEKELKEASEISMGTEIAEEDLENIHALCDQIISITEYRTQLYEYLKNRMNAIAPNLTAMVGELVGARLIAHAGSLMTLAKHPASTIQILGAEKALFRALKTKHDTPKYGLIYHASLIGQAGPKIKGKIARMVATKTALSVRVDALGATDTPAIGMENRSKVEARLRMLEGHGNSKVSSADRKAAGKAKNQQKSDFVASSSYNTSSDVTMKAAAPESGAKRKARDEDDEDDDDEVDTKVVKKQKKEEKKDKKGKDIKEDKKGKGIKEDKKEKK